MWVEITEDDVLTVLNGEELAGIRSAALSVGQDDPVESAIIQVVNQVRGAVGACDRNTLGDGDTIPDELMAFALDLLAVRIPSRVGADATETRQGLAKEAAKQLNRVADCKFHIQDPVTEAPAETTPPRPSITARKRRFDRDSQDGI